MTYTFRHRDGVGTRAIPGEASVRWVDSGDSVMLVIEPPHPPAQDDDGAVLVTVVVVMLVGFVVATVIAASVLFTIRSNVSNTDRTQAFISAESGRDAALASLTGAINSSGDLICNAGMLSATGTEPTYAYKIRSTQLRPQRSRRVGNLADLTDACPTTRFELRRHSVDGHRPGWVDSDNRLGVSLARHPRRTARRHDGLLRWANSRRRSRTYEGDLVIRGTATVHLQQLQCDRRRSLGTSRPACVLSTDCKVTGSIYVFGNGRRVEQRHQHRRRHHRRRRHQHGVQRSRRRRERSSPARR